MKWLYKYPQREYPYAQLVEENQRRARPGPGVRAARHRASSTTTATSTSSSSTRRRRPRTSRSAITVENRGPGGGAAARAARTSGSATPGPGATSRERRAVHHARGDPGRASSCLVADDRAAEPLTQPALRLPPRRAPPLRARRAAELLFTDNETNAPRVYGPWAQSRRPYVKDAFHRHVVNGEDAREPRRGRAPRPASHYRVRGAGRRLGRRCGCGSRRDARRARSPTSTRIVAERAGRGRRVLRRDPAARPPPPTRSWSSARPSPGMLWSKQIYLFDVNLWLEGDNPRWPPPESRDADPQRPLAPPQLDAHPVDARQVGVPVVRGLGPGLPLRRRWPSSTPSSPRSSSGCCSSSSSSIPSGQIPAYEWEFSDLNPPVHAWAVWRVYNMDRIRTGKADRVFLETLLPQAADQLRLVGQQGGPRGQQRLRGRLPRPRQHHGHRPQREAARRAPSSSSPTPRAGWACSA